MRVEIRKSGGDACPTCGALELAETKLGKPLVWDSLHLMETEWKRRERDLQEAFQARLAEHAAQSNARAVAARTAITELEAHHEELHALAAQGIEQLIGPEYRKVRVLARKRRRKLVEQATPIVEQLLADTRKV